MENGSEDAAPQSHPDLTAAMARAYALHARSGLPARVRLEAQRALLNAAAAAIGSSDDPATQTLVRHHAHRAPMGNCTVPGLAATFNPVAAANIAGLAANIGSFDDTHIETIVHPAGPALGAVLGALGEGHVEGERTLTAFALGCELQIRLGLAFSSSHYRLGWHVTGTCGVSGAAVSAAALLGADAPQMRAALKLAAHLYVGSREGFGSMTKGHTVGQAAGNGLLAAMAATDAATTGSYAIDLGSEDDEQRSLLHALSEDARPDELLAGLGTRWHLLDNTYRAYPCGVVIHPLIDAALELRSDDRLYTDIETVDAHCHELVPNLTGGVDPRDPMQARLSAPHSIAVALLDGVVGPQQYEWDRVLDPDVSELRRRVRLHPHRELDRHQARMRIGYVDGSSREALTHAARGSLDRPLTDAELREKAALLVDPRLGPGSGERLAEAVWDLPAQPDSVAFLAAMSSGGNGE